MVFCVVLSSPSSAALCWQCTATSASSSHDFFILEVQATFLVIAVTFSVSRQCFDMARTRITAAVQERNLCFLETAIPAQGISVS